MLVEIFQVGFPCLTAVQGTVAQIIIENMNPFSHSMGSEYCAQIAARAPAQNQIHSYRFIHHRGTAQLISRSASYLASTF